MDPIALKPIGTIHSPFKSPQDMPIQPTGARGVRGWVALDPALQEGLRDLEGFSHIFLIYVFHRAGPPRLTVTPFMDDRPRGVFATRAPSRPNPIGLSLVRLVAVRGARLEIEDVDILDGTPLLDLKPYVPAFDCAPAARIGWLTGRAECSEHTRADDRFAAGGEEADADSQP